MTAEAPTDVELVLAAAATYLVGATPAIATDRGAIRIFTAQSAAGATIISVEGTHDPIGWAIDFLALEFHPGVQHAALGWLHAGFYATALQVYGKVKQIAASSPGGFAVSGHSLGAAQSLLLAAMLILDGLRPLKVGAFAPPRVGGDAFVKVATSVPVCGRRFGIDIVPTVPFTLPNFPYQQIPLTEVGAGTTLGRLSSHHINNYVAAERDLAGEAA